MKKLVVIMISIFLMINSVSICADELSDEAAKIQEIQESYSGFAADSAEINIDEAFIKVQETLEERGFLEFLATFSTDPADLDPLRGTTWDFTYTIYTTTFTDTLRFGTTTQTTSDGAVALSARNQFNSSGAVFFVFDTPIGQAFACAIEGITLINFYTFKVNGSSSTGRYQFRMIDTGEYSNVYSMSGVKIAGPTTTSSSVITTTTSIPVVTTTTSSPVITTTTSIPGVTTTIILPGTYSISGTVRGDIRANVTIKLTGTASRNTTTNQDGQYTFSDLAGGYYTITPDNAAYDFEPVNYIVQNLTSDLTSMDFVATEYKAMPCAAEVIYGEDSKEVIILRVVRDNFLSKTPEGRELIKVYYQWSPIIVKAIENDEEFKKEIKQMIDKYVH